MDLSPSGTPLLEYYVFDMHAQKDLYILRKLVLKDHLLQFELMKIRVLCVIKCSVGSFNRSKVLMKKNYQPILCVTTLYTNSEDNVTE